MTCPGATGRHRISPASPRSRHDLSAHDRTDSAGPGARCPTRARWSLPDTTAH